MILLDPMLATGNSTAAAVETVKARRARRRCALIALIAAPEGIERDPRASTRTSRSSSPSIDRGLNEKGYIVPGPRRRRRPAVRHEVARSDVRRAAGDPGGPLRSGRSPSSIVVLLTPAVGGHGAPPRRRRPARTRAASTAGRSRGSAGSRSSSGSSSRRSRSSTSRARCAGILLGAAVAMRRRRDRRLPRARSGATKLAGQVAGRRRSRRAFGVWIDHFTFPFLGVVDLPAWIGVPLTIVWIVAVMNMVNFLDGHRRSRSRRLRDRGRDVRDHRALAREARRRRFSPRSSPARASASCGTTSSRRGSSWATRARSCSASRSPRSRSQGLLKTASTVVLLPSAARARRADHRHVVRRRAAAEARPADLRRRPQRTSTTASSTSASRSGGPRSPCGPGARASARRALATRFIPFREGGDWHPLETVVVVAIALVALAFSVYVVYLLEIVKLANPRVRRREREQDDARDRMTA